MILKDSAGSSSFIQTSEGLSQLASGPNSITTTADGGNFINGPLSVSSPPENVIFGGIFRLNPALQTCIPSTMVTPIPTFIIDIPAKKLSMMMAVAGMVSSVL